MSRRIDEKKATHRERREQKKKRRKYEGDERLKADSRKDFEVS